MSDSECWNTQDTCSYRQTFLVNPLIGGFSSFMSEYENSNFVSYQFTGSYKLSAQDNKVVIYTTDKCSQATVTFDFAAVIFQQKVKPEKRKTSCKQIVNFEEQKYVIQIDPFQQQLIDVGLMIFASCNNLIFTQIKLDSLIKEDIISKQLYHLILQRLPQSITIEIPELSIPSNVVDDPGKPHTIFQPLKPIYNHNKECGETKSITDITTRSGKTIYYNTNTSLGYTIVPLITTVLDQTIILKDSILPLGNSFIRWEVRDYNSANTILYSSSDPIWTVKLPKRQYTMGFSYISISGAKFYGIYVNLPINGTITTIDPAPR